MSLQTKFVLQPYKDNIRRIPRGQNWEFLLSNIFKEGKNDDVDFSEYPVGENPLLRTLVPLGTKFIF
jgi:hypothetical protein